MAGRIDLSRRETSALELMDDPACDPDALDRTYGHFAIVNRLVAGWRSVYVHLIRPALRARLAQDATGPASLLDIGSGGGDVSRALASWAAHDGLPLEITAIDPDPRAHAFASSLPPTPGVAFERADSRTLVEAGRRFDVVVSNHVLHHLDPRDLAALLDDSEHLARGLAVHNDIARGRLAYAAYAVATSRTFRGSFIHDDGLLSIRRSYRAGELEGEIPVAWKVSRQWPFRLLLTYAPSLDGRSPRA